MTEPIDGNFIASLEIKIRELEKRKAELEPAVIEFNGVEDQLQLLRRTRNAFVHAPHNPPSVPPALRPVPPMPRTTYFVPRRPGPPSPPNKQTSLPQIMEAIAAEHTRGRLSLSILSLLREIGRPLHSDEIMTRLRQMGFKASRPTIVGSLARFYREGKLNRPSPGVYAFKD